MKQYITLFIVLIFGVMTAEASQVSINTPIVQKKPGIKGIVFFKKAEDISYNEFVHQWRDLHYPMVYLFDFDGYVQNSKLPDQPSAMHSPYDGVLNVWFETAGAKEKTYSSPFWPIVSAHEPAMLQPDSLISLTVDEYVILNRPVEKSNSWIKLILATKRSPKVAREKFNDFWLGRHAYDVVSLMSANQGLLRYTISPVRGGAVQQKNREPEASAQEDYTVVEELWFKNRSFLDKAINSTAWKSQHLGAAPYMASQDTLIAEEFIGVTPRVYTRRQ